VGQFEQDISRRSRTSRVSPRKWVSWPRGESPVRPKPKKPDEAPGSIAMELADILFVVICIANSQRIDLDDAFKQVMAKVTSRDAGRWSRKAR